MVGSAEFIVPWRRLSCGFQRVHLQFKFLLHLWYVCSGKPQIPFYFNKEKPLSPSSHDACGQMKRQCTNAPTHTKGGNLLIESKIVSCVDNAQRWYRRSTWLTDRSNVSNSRLPRHPPCLPNQPFRPAVQSLDNNLYFCDGIWYCIWYHQTVGPAGDRANTPTQKRQTEHAINILAMECIRPVWPAPSLLHFSRHITSLPPLN